MSASKIARIRNAYTNIGGGGGFSSVQKLFVKLQNQPGNEDIKKKDIRNFLSEVPSNTMNRTAIRRMKRREDRIPINEIDYMYDADLMDMQHYLGDNNNYRYILVVIDVFSRFLYTQPLKTKSAKDMVVAFREIFKEANPPNTLRTDGGSEFTNKQVQDLFRELDIYHYVTQSEHHAYFAERVIRTLRTIMGRYRVYRNTHKWVDVLQELTRNYNATYHNSIRMTPREVSKDNQDQVWANQVLLPILEKRQKIKKEKKRRKVPFKVKIGDHVRISYKKGVQDSEGESALLGLKTLGFNHVETVGTAQVYVIEGNLSREEVDDMCQRLLANPVSQDYFIREVK